PDHGCLAGRLPSSLQLDRRACAHLRVGVTEQDRGRVRNRHPATVVSIANRAHDRPLEFRVPYMTDSYNEDLRSDRFTTVIPGSMVLRGAWDDRILAPSSVALTMDLNDPDVRALGLRNVATPAKSFLARVDGSHVVAGPIWAYRWEGDTRLLQLDAKG